MMVLSDTMYVSFDTLGNDIEDVQLLPAGSAMAATLNAGVIPLVDNPVAYDVKINLNNQIGDVLAVGLPFTYGAGSTFSLHVFYTTQPGGNIGVNFLTPDQTNDGMYPMLYTYTQDIYGRMIAPQQDTPSIRITWGACVTVNDTFTPFMSAN